VWLLRELFLRQPGAVEALIDPGLGRAMLTFKPGETDLSAYVRAVEQFGYGVGPALKDADDRESQATLARLGVCVALSMNAMAFAGAFYFGLTPADGEVFGLMRWLNIALSAAVVAIGGSEFFSRSVRGLRSGILSFDVPIALGLLLSFGGASWLSYLDPSTFSYFDTLDIFTTLMLVGRWLQQRVLNQNRRRLLADDGVAGLYARRVVHGQVEVVAAARLAVGDTVLVPSGDLVVAPLRLLGERPGSFSLDWINGESMPRAFAPGSTVPAGSFNAQQTAALGEVTQAFSASPLLALLSQEDTQPGEAQAGYGALLSQLARFYVPTVLAVAGLTLWARWGHGVAAAVQAATSVLVVTCPCALGLAIPLAYQLTSVELRRRGLFLVREGFLDRAARVKRVAFDKTGTLTLGTLTVSNPEALDALDPAALSGLYNLACRSLHPRSRSVAEALAGRAVRFEADLEVTEAPGQGMSLRARDGHLHQLGSPAWLGAPAAEGAQALWYACDGQVLARLALEEHLRPAARQALSALARPLAEGGLGLSLAMLSGDDPERVARVAERLGFAAEDAHGGLSPQGKLEWLRQRGGRADTLLVGDGLNDRLAMEEVLCSGTPAVDRPTLAARADFYFLTPDLGCVPLALRAARGLRRTTHVILAAGLTYNVLAIVASFLGWVGPLAAAVAMPASSVLILLYTARATALSADVPRADPRPAGLLTATRSTP
jgi:Cu2+-exporting ATPase